MTSNAATGVGGLVAQIGMIFMLGALLSGCAWFSPDSGMNAVSDIAAQDAAAIRSPEEARDARAVITRLLSRPLTANAAVQIALLNNRGLQAAYNELAIAETQRVGASLPPSPTFSLFRVSGSVETEIERQLVIDVVALAALPAASEIATTRFHQAQLRAAEDTLRIAAQTRRAYRLMGLWGDDLKFKLPAVLPPPPIRVQNLVGIELEAVGRRVDLQISRLEIEALARSYGLTKAAHT
jgi:outer membrane protein TolC